MLKIGYCSLVIGYLISVRILAIETSCDETSASIVEGINGAIRIFSNAVGSQIQTHARYGGVVPELAARRHAELIVELVKLAVGEFKGSDIDAVAVTYGPGLMVCLLVGIETAKGLSYAWGKPFIAVNHLEGHVYSIFGEGAMGYSRDVGKATVSADFFEKPSIALVVSGGHTELIVVERYGCYKLLGRTRDDAAGEAFDKVAILLGLSYPGGPSISAAAETGDPQAYAMPRAMLDSHNFDFSFSGIKTHVKNAIKKLGRASAIVPHIAASFQEAVCDTLVAKTVAAAFYYNVGRIIVTGGVSANARLREKFAEAAAQTGIACYFPGKALTGDNAAMIGIAGYLKHLHTKRYDDIFTIRPNPDLKWENLP